MFIALFSQLNKVFDILKSLFYSIISESSFMIYPTKFPRIRGGKAYSLSYAFRYQLVKGQLTFHQL